jgi:CheY-like chemotaxis protein
MSKILIADDNEQNSGILQDVLESFSYDVVIAASGDEALYLAKDEKPDIILLDVMMPGLSGYEVCQKIRQNPSTSHIPVVLLTALSEVEDRIHGYNVGANIFMTKPINYKELLAMIKKFLKEKGELDLTEPLDKVVNFLSEFLPPSGKQEVSGELFLAVEQKYGHQMIHALQLPNKAARYLDIAIRVQGLSRCIQEDKGKGKIKKALSELQMGKWLLPILTYTGENSQLSQKEEQNAFNQERDNSEDAEFLGKVAEIFLVLKNYAEFYKDNKGNRSDALTALRRSTKTGQCNPLIVEQLAEIVKNRMLLEDLQ